MSVTLPNPTCAETWEESDDLSDVTPISGGVPIRYVPHADLLLDLADEHGFREGFCRWAEALVQVYDQTAERRTQYELRDLGSRATVLRDQLDEMRSDFYANLGASQREFAEDDTPLRQTLRNLISKVGIVRTAKLLEWEPRTVIGWALGPRASANWHGWVAVDRLVAAGAAPTVAAHIGSVSIPVLKALQLPGGR